MAAPARFAPRVCLVSFGSAGDIHPMLAIGQELRARGRRVTLLSTPGYAQAASEAGLDFVPVGSDEDAQRTMAHPKLWHPIDGLGVMWRYLLRPALAPTYEALAHLQSQEPVVAVASPVAMGARIAQERLALPLLTAYTAATMLRTVHDPMTLASWRVPSWFPAFGRRAAWALLDRYKLEPLVRPALEPFRAQLGLPPLAGKVFADWMHSPQGGIALFPDWFAPAAPDWPMQVVQAGFPLYDDPASTGPLASEHRAFIEAGPAPVVFMPGTARPGADDFFLAALRYCEQHDVRGVLLGAPSHSIAASVSPDVLVQPYAPFATLLPHARALVHHGGIGSAAQALRAGIPQLVVPHAYDQFDNAMRLERLGVAASVPATPEGLERLPQVLHELLESERVAQACARCSRKADAASARAVIADRVEALAA